MLQANPALTNTQIIQAMQTGALPMSARATSAAGYDFDNGHGFLDVSTAFAQLPAAAPTITVSPTSITVGATATLTWNAINVTGCTASGSWTGSQPASGTQTVTPGVAGSATYTLSCTGSNGAVSSSTTLTVNAAASGHSGGGAIDAGTLLALGCGAVLLTVRRMRPQPRLVALVK
jgi:hypothetical protein